MVFATIELLMKDANEERSGERSADLIDITREMVDRVKRCATSRPERTTIRLHFANQLPKKFQAIGREWHFATSDTIFTDME